VKRWETLGLITQAALKDGERHDLAATQGQVSFAALGAYATEILRLEQPRPPPLGSALDSSICVHNLAISSNVSRCRSLAASSAQRRHCSALHLHSSIVSILVPAMR
jgi:hypothetical protein